MHISDNGQNPNALGLSPEELRLRKVEVVDILTLGHKTEDAEYDARFVSRRRDAHFLYRF